MIVFWIGSFLFAILLAALFRTERALLEEQRARRRAQILDAARLTAALLMFLALPIAEPRPLATVGLGLAAFAFVAVPSSWAANLAGMDPRWELRRLQAEGADLMKRYGSPMPPDGAEKIRHVIADLDRARSKDTAELCDLLAVRYGDWIAGEYRPLSLGRRVVRIYELEVRLFGDEVRAPELSEKEATFRWHLYRVLGHMVECGVEGQTDRQRVRFRKLMTELEGYRQVHTAAFIDVVRDSACAWLESPDPRPAWRPGPDVLRGAAPSGGGDALWPHTSIFWGAVLDEGDRADLRKVTGRSRS